MTDMKTFSMPNFQLFSGCSESLEFGFDRGAYRYSFLNTTVFVISSIVDPFFIVMCFFLLPMD